MKKFSCLAPLVLFFSLNLSATEDQDSDLWGLYDYICSSIDACLKFDGIINFGPDIFPDIRSLYSIRTEPYSAEEWEIIKP